MTDYEEKSELPNLVSFLPCRVVDRVTGTYRTFGEDSACSRHGKTPNDSIKHVKRCGRILRSVLLSSWHTKSVILDKALN